MRRLFKDAQGKLFETSGPNEDPVQFCTQGGGWACSMPYEDFHRTFKPGELPEFRPVLVTGDWWEHYPEYPPIRAYSNGRRWNGWAVPYFTLEAAIEVATRLPKWFHYFPLTGLFVKFGEPDSGEENSVIHPETIEVDGAMVTVYRMGDGYCWDIVD